MLKSKTMYIHVVVAKQYDFFLNSFGIAMEKLVHGKLKKGFRPFFLTIFDIFLKLNTLNTFTLDVHNLRKKT